MIILISCASVKFLLYIYVSKSLECVTELVQRTNQLNFSGRKYDRNQIQTILDDTEREKWVLEFQDKFGSYGMVGFCIVRRQETKVIEIGDFMLSCRVRVSLSSKRFLISWLSSVLRAM